MISNNIKVAALWLLSEGRSVEYVAKKFGVSLKTVYNWAAKREQITKQNKEELFEYLLNTSANLIMLDEGIVTLIDCD